MTSQPDQKTFTIHILPNISPSKGNQAMEFGLVISKYHAENETRKLVPDLFLFFKKALDEVKANGLELSFIIFRQPSIWHKIKTNYIKL